MRKIYFYDTGQVVGSPGIRLENLTACALLKEIQYLEDCYGEEMRLHYLQTRDGKEIDFFVSRESLPGLMIEVKWSDSKPSGNFKLFDRYFTGVGKIQLVRNLQREKSYPEGIELRKASDWLASLSLLE